MYYLLDYYFWKKSLLQCFNPKCLQARGALPTDQQLLRNTCNHIKEAKKARDTRTYAIQKTLDLDEVLSSIADESLEQILRYEASDNLIVVYILPGGNIAVPLLGLQQDQYMSDHVHLRDLKCSLIDCTKKKSKIHSLVSKGTPICRHALLGE